MIEKTPEPINSCRYFGKLRYVIVVCFGVLLFNSCNSNYSDPQKIVDKVILQYGGNKYLHSTIEFDFRKRHYVAIREGGIYSYERIFTDKDSVSKVHDFLTNNGFVREIDQQRKAIPDSMAKKYSASVRLAQLPSVHQGCFRL